MSYSNSNVDGVFIMPKKICAHLGTKPEYIAVALYVFANGGDINIKACATQLSISENEVLSAIAYWHENGIFENGGQAVKVNTDTVKTYVTPSYTNEEMARVLNESEFSSFYKWVETKLGRILNSAEQEKLYGLYDAVGVSYDVISGIIEYCVSIGKKSMRYIERTVISIHDEGISNYNELQSYFQKRKTLENTYESVKSLIGADNRALTKSEKNYIDKWVNIYGSSFELMEHAYEKTVNSIAKPSVSYMSKILESWYVNGYKTVEQVEKGVSVKGGYGAEDTKKLNLYDFIEKPQN